ncbi:MAG: S41 family peptidase [Bdellovibrionales bacterium]|nr:S41 family peptidase [Bdellovibrionales bacterium]
MKTKKPEQYKLFKPGKKKSFLAISFVLLFSSFLVFADRYGDLELFAKVLNLIEKNYLKPLNAKVLVHGAIRGLLREIDPHSYFLTPADMNLFTKKTQGKHYGIGIEIEKKEKNFIILSVIPNSPAERAGLKQGDQVIKVNGELIDHLTVDEFLQKVRKTKTYKLTISRINKTQPLNIRIKPGKLKIQSIQFQKLDEEKLYVRIFQFTKTTFSELFALLKKHPPKKGLLLDLRGNPGGLFEQAIKITDLFINTGNIVHFKTRVKKQRQSFKAMQSNTLPDFPLVILIDEYSASASEVLAGALRDHKRALLIGRKTFGKGSIQNLFHMKNNYGLKLTVGEYQTPSGKSIHGKGIEPHIPIEKQTGNNLSLNVTGKSTLKDPEVIQALKYLNDFKKMAKKFL